jgi:hypothetical protein
MSALSAPQTDRLADPIEPEPVSELERRLREAGADELLGLLAEHLERLEVPAVRQALRNPHLTAEAVERIAGQTRLLAFYEVKRAVALHPRTPETLALRFVPGLFWRDLVALGLDMRVRPQVRRAAEIHLTARLAELAVGEKVALARRASPGILAHLRHDPSPRVFAALLDNRRLTEAALMPVALGAGTPSPILATLAADRRWGVRYPVQVALSRNPNTPLETALRLLPRLRKLDIRGVSADPRTPEAVRQRARLLLGEAF